MGAGVNKVLLWLGDRQVCGWSFMAANMLGGIGDDVIVATDADYEQMLDTGGERLAPPGPERHDSEWNALQVIARDIDEGLFDIVAIHDLARPFASTELWRSVIAAAWEHGGAIPVQPLDGLIHRDGTPAPGLVGVQTPQAFRAKPLLEAYRRAAADGFKGTDTAACIERYTDLRIVGVPSSAVNLKITFPEDVRLAERLMASLT